MDDEQFFAWLDGELDGDAAAQVAARVAASPELQARAEAHRKLGATLRGAFQPVAEEAVPEGITNAARGRGRVVSLSQRTAKPIPVVAQWAAMAATLAIGIVTGTMIAGGSSAPVEREGGRLVASANLEEALYARLASAPIGEGPRIGLTFRDKSGAICRTFTDEAASGLACREEGDWRIRGLFQAGEGQQGDYRMAAGADPRLAAMVEEAIAGEPFDAAAERQAQDKGWR